MSDQVSTIYSINACCDKHPVVDFSMERVKDVYRLVITIFCYKCDYTMKVCNDISTLISGFISMCDLDRQRKALIDEWNNEVKARSPGLE